MSLHSYAETGNTSKLQEVLSGANVSINERDGEGQTALHYAAALNFPECVEVLLKCKADPNVTNQQGTSPLHEAVRNNNETCAKILLQGGADVMRLDNDGWTPLHYATLVQNKSMCQILLESGSQPDIRSFVWDTPSHIAAVLSNTEILSLLIQKGVPPDDAFAKLKIQELPTPSPKDKDTLSLSFRTKDLAKNTKELFNNKSWSDLTVIANDGTTCSAHKNILAVRCPYFRQLLEASPTETKLSVDVKGDILLAILEWLYTADIERLNIRKIQAQKAPEPGKKKESFIDICFALEILDAAVRFGLNSFIPILEAVLYMGGESVKTPLSDVAVSVLTKQAHRSVSGPSQFMCWCAIIFVKYFKDISLSTAFKQMKQEDISKILSYLPTEKAAQLPESYTQKLQQIIKPRPVMASRKLSEKNKRLCINLLKGLIRTPGAEEYNFNAPVDIHKWGILDYYDVIKHPMDFGTILKNLNSDKYATPNEFIADVRLVFLNAKRYNGDESPVGKFATELQSIFESKLSSTQFEKPGKPTTPAYKKASKGLTPVGPSQAGSPPLPGTPTSLPSPAQFTPPGSASVDGKAPFTDPTKKRKAETQTTEKSATFVVTRPPTKLEPLTFEDKKRIGSRINDLTNDQLIDALEIISQSKQVITESDTDTIDIDMNEMDDTTLRRLDQFIQQCSQKVQVV